MKKSKKFLSILYAACMILAVSAPAFAAEATDSNPKSLAYMDIMGTTPEMYADIITARREIIYGNQSWSADGTVVEIIHADGTVELVPQFSDVFPGWDLNEITQPVPDLYDYGPFTARATIHYQVANITLSYPSAGVTTEPFLKFNGNGSKVYAKALLLPEGMTKYSIGFNNEDTGAEISYLANMELGDKTSLQTEDGVRYGVRASSANVGVSGLATMSVSEDPDAELE